MSGPSYTSSLQTISSDRPWPGLMSFDESAQQFFFGREVESTALLRLVRRDMLTVLFGQSGLGKSSLLTAGVFPQLRREGFFPTHLRLDVSLDAAPFRQQLAETLAEDCRRHHVDARPISPGQTLWEYFHGEQTDFWSTSNQLLTPVLVFDQFEELFTLGQRSTALRTRCADFLAELGDLVENRMPKALQQEVEANETRTHGVDFDKTRHRVVFCFREDYLAEFEGLKHQMRPIMRNRMRLLPMSAVNAIDAVLKAGRAHVTPEVANGIVGFVAGVGDIADSWDGVEVEPALLSLVCRELNEERLDRNEAVISTELIRAGNADRIIEHHYRNCFRGVDANVRRFVEDQLLTKSGFRDSCAVEEATDLAGIAPATIDLLVQRRLLRYDIRHGVRRIELTHDILTQVARRSRDARHANERAEQAIRQAESARKEAEQLRKLHADARHYFGLALAEKAERAFQQARQLDRKLYAVHALANLDRSRAPSEYLMALGHRLSVLQAEVAKVPQVFGTLRFVPDTTLIAVNTDRSISAYDTTRFTLVDEMITAVGGMAQFEISGTGRHIAARTRDGRIYLWRTPDYRQMIPATAVIAAVTCLAFSPSGRYLAFGCDNGALRVLDLGTGHEVGKARNTMPFTVEHPPTGIGWAPSERCFFSFSERASCAWAGEAFVSRRELVLGTAEPMAIRQSHNHCKLAIVGRNRMLYSYEIDEADDGTATLRKGGGVMGQSEAVRGLAISVDGSVVATAADNMVKLFDWSLGRQLTALPAGDDIVLSLDFSPDGRWLAAGNRGGQVLRWPWPLQDWQLQVRRDEQAAGYHLDGVTIGPTRGGAA